MVSPEAWTTPPAARLLPGILRYGGIRIGPTGKPTCLHPFDMIGKGLRFFVLGCGIRQGLLMRQLAGMPHDKAQGLLRHASIAPLHLYRPHDALATPAAWRLVLRAAGFLHSQRQSGLLLAPGFQFLTHGTGPGHERHEPQVAFQAQAQCPATVPLTISHNPAAPIKTEGGRDIPQWLQAFPYYHFGCHPAGRGGEAALHHH
jgi:hypothetical protein